MKIALLTPTFYHFSGIDRVVELDAEKFSKQGHEVTIITFKASIKPKNVRLITIGMPKNQTLERIYRLLFFLDRKKIKKYSDMLKNFDVIKAYFYPMTWIARRAKKKYGIKYIYWDAGVGFPELFDKLHEKIYLKLFIIFLRWSVQNADESISISHFLKKQLRKETGLKSRVEYIEIDKKRFHKKVKGRSKIRKKYKIGKNDKVLFYIGRLSPHKSIPILIRAFKIVQTKYPNSWLIIGGKATFPSYFTELKKLANKNVIFAGFIPDEDLPKYYAACDIYTTASLWEGFDLPVVEAQECGKNVVAFDCCSHPEVVKKGILIKPKNLDNFSKAILNILKKNQNESPS